MTSFKRLFHISPITFPLNPSFYYCFRSQTGWTVCQSSAICGIRNRSPLCCTSKLKNLKGSRSWLKTWNMIIFPFWALTWWRHLPLIVLLFTDESWRACQIITIPSQTWSWWKSQLTCRRFEKVRHDSPDCALITLKTIKTNLKIRGAVGFVTLAVADTYFRTLWENPTLLLSQGWKNKAVKHESAACFMANMGGKATNCKNNVNIFLFRKFKRQQVFIWACAGERQINIQSPSGSEVFSCQVAHYVHQINFLQALREQL